jgi:3-hydroxybutyryl-CoA dehydrogenase
MVMNSRKLHIGVVGLGLMGASIATAMILLGHRVTGLSPVDSETDQSAPEKIRRSVRQAIERRLVIGEVAQHMELISFSNDYRSLATCNLIIESVIENLVVKQEVIKKIEEVVSKEAIITTNTSAIPINILQEFLKHKRRFFGMHWGEPAFTSKFLEIICGDQSDMALGAQLQQIALDWGKEPTLVRKDIRGFITNRLMYAMYREAFYLVENGYASMKDIDRACRNDGGIWMAFCGPFRYMDLTGLQAYYQVMKDLFPTLNNRTTVPDFIEKIASEGSNGLSTGSGFYTYTPQEAQAWQTAFETFSFEISRLKNEHPPKALKELS